MANQTVNTSKTARDERARRAREIARDVFRDKPVGLFVRPAETVQRGLEEAIQRTRDKSGNRRPNG